MAGYEKLQQSKHEESSWLITEPDTIKCNKWKPLSLFFIIFKPNRVYSCSVKQTHTYCSLSLYAYAPGDVQMNSIIRATSQLRNSKFDFSSWLRYMFFLQHTLSSNEAVFLSELCSERLLCISVCSKGRQSRGTWNYISHKNNTRVSHDLSYFPSSNSILGIWRSRAPKCNVAIYTEGHRKLNVEIQSKPWGVLPSQISLFREYC